MFIRYVPYLCLSLEIRNTANLPWLSIKKKIYKIRKIIYIFLKMFCLMGNSSGKTCKIHQIFHFRNFLFVKNQDFQVMTFLAFVVSL